jgi:hypothetical protein
MREQHGAYVEMQTSNISGFETRDFKICGLVASLITVTVFSFMRFSQLLECFV